MIAANSNDPVGLQQFTASINRTLSVRYVACRNHKLYMATLENRKRRLEMSVLRMNISDETYSPDGHAIYYQEIWDVATTALFQWLHSANRIGSGGAAAKPDVVFGFVETAACTITTLHGDAEDATRAADAVAVERTAAQEASRCAFY